MIKKKREHLVNRHNFENRSKTQLLTHCKCFEDFQWAPKVVKKKQDKHNPKDPQVDPEFTNYIFDKIEKQILNISLLTVVS